MVAPLPEFLDVLWESRFSDKEHVYSERHQTEADPFSGCEAFNLDCIAHPGWSNHVVGHTTFFDTKDQNMFFFKSFISQSCINHHGNTESGLLHNVFLCGALRDCSNHEPEPKRPTGLLKQTDDVLTPGDWSLTSSPTIPWCTPATRRSEFSKGQGPRARRRFKRFLGLAQPNLRLLVAL